MTALAIALLVAAVFLFIAEAHAPTTVLGLLGVRRLVGAGFAWRDAGHDLPVAAIVHRRDHSRRLHRLRLPKGDRRPSRSSRCERARSS